MGEYSWMEYKEPFDCIYEKYLAEQIADVKGCKKIKSFCILNNCLIYVRFVRQR